MAIPFGVSARDFISALFLIRTIWGALEETHGAAPQFRTVMTIFKSLEVTVKQLKTIHCDNEALSTALQEATGKFEDAIDLFIKKIDKYHPSLKKGGSANKLEDARRKIQYALCSKDDVAKFRTEILGHAAHIQMILLSAQM